MVAGTVSGIVAILIIIVVVFVVRRRAKCIDRESTRQDNGDTRSLRGHRDHRDPISGIHLATDNGDIETLSQSSVTSSHRTLGQPAMSVNGSKNYPPSSYPASTLPSYAERHRSMSPPAFSDLSMRQLQDIVSRDSLKQG